MGLENCRTGTFLGYAGLGYTSPKGHALIDRRLYLREAWIEATERRKATGIFEAVTFAALPENGRHHGGGGAGRKRPVRMSVGRQGRWQRQELARHA